MRLTGTKNFIFAYFYFLGSFLLLTGCGFDDSEYQPYESAAKDEGSASSDESGNQTTDGSASPKDCAASAQAVFNVSVAPSINSTCSNCHGEAGHALPFKNGANADNRSQLFGWLGTDADKLFDFISGPDHPGGNQSQALPLAKIKSWTDAEEKCSS